MAKYNASPFYAVDVGKSSVKFNYFGEYETDNTEEIAALDALVPIWITKEVTEEPVASAEAPKPKAPTTRKPSAK